MSDPATPTSVELIVPSPLPRSLTIKPPKDLSLVLSVCGEALKMYGQQKVSAVTILVVLQHILTAINKLTKLSVEDKKELALESIQWLIDNQKDLSDDEKSTLDLLAVTVFPQAIDLLAEETALCMSLSCFGKK